MTIEEMNSFDDIDNYYEAEIPQFIQEILEERVEALKHCITYKKEIERLNNIINAIEKALKDNIEELKDLTFSYDRIDEDKNILRFIQELKGSDK